MGVRTVRDLDRILAHSTVPEPPEVESVLARAEKGDEVFADRFSAAEFVTMVRTRYLAREPNLQELIEPLGGLGSAPVLFCQVESDEAVVSLVLDEHEHEHEVLAVISLDRSRTARTISVGDLRGLLWTSPPGRKPRPVLARNAARRPAPPPRRDRGRQHREDALDEVQPGT